jgi:heterodisulfide reductase subunit A-like polyferredoxin
MNTLPFQVESEFDVRYTVLHPQLCGQGGYAALEDALRDAGPDSIVVVGACAPETQMKLFKKLLRATGFEERRFVPVDIRGTDNQGILERLKTTIERIAAERGVAGTVAADKTG